MSDKNVFEKKPFFKEIYRRIYWEALNVIYDELTNPIKVLEIGSGEHGFIKEIDSNIITSDIEYFKNCDYIINAEHLPFDGGELNAIIGIQVLHHIKNIDNFLREAVRTVKPNGLVVLIEPNWGPVSTVLHKYFHNEPYDKKQSFESALYTNDTNQAVSYVLFKKYKKQFLQYMAQLSFLKTKKLSFLEYIMSGGFNCKLSAPASFMNFFRTIDNMLAPFMDILAIHQMIVLKREETEIENTEVSNRNCFIGDINGSVGTSKFK